MQPYRSQIIGEPPYRPQIIGGPPYRFAPPLQNQLYPTPTTMQFVAHPAPVVRGYLVSQPDDHHQYSAYQPTVSASTNEVRLSAAKSLQAEVPILYKQSVDSVDVSVPVAVTRVVSSNANMQISSPRSTDINRTKDMPEFCPQPWSSESSSRDSLTKYLFNPESPEFTPTFALKHEKKIYPKGCKDLKLDKLMSDDISQDNLKKKDISYRSTMTQTDLEGCDLEHLCNNCKKILSLFSAVAKPDEGEFPKIKKISAEHKVKYLASQASMMVRERPDIIQSVAEFKMKLMRKLMNMCRQFGLQSTKLSHWEDDVICQNAVNLLVDSPDLAETKNSSSFFRQLNEEVWSQMEIALDLMVDEDNDKQTDSSVKVVNKLPHGSGPARKLPRLKKPSSPLDLTTIPKVPNGKLVNEVSSSSSVLNSATESSANLNKVSQATSKPSIYTWTQAPSPSNPAQMMQKMSSLKEPTTVSSVTGSRTSPFTTQSFSSCCTSMPTVNNLGITSVSSSFMPLVSSSMPIPSSFIPSIPSAVPTSSSMGQMANLFPSDLQSQLISSSLASGALGPNLLSSNPYPDLLAGSFAPSPLAPTPSSLQGGITQTNPPVTSSFLQTPLAPNSLLNNGISEADELSQLIKLQQLYIDKLSRGESIDSLPPSLLLFSQNMGLSSSGSENADKSGSKNTDTLSSLNANPGVEKTQSHKALVNESLVKEEESRPTSEKNPAPNLSNPLNLSNKTVTKSGISALKKGPVLDLRTLKSKPAVKKPVVNTEPVVKPTEQKELDFQSQPSSLALEQFQLGETKKDIDCFNFQSILHKSAPAGKTLAKFGEQKMPKPLKLMTPLQRKRMKMQQQQQQQQQQQDQTDIIDSLPSESTDGEQFQSQSQNSSISETARLEMSVGPKDTAPVLHWLEKNITDAGHSSNSEGDDIVDSVKNESLNNNSRTMTIEQAEPRTIPNPNGGFYSAWKQCHETSNPIHQSSSKLTSSSGDKKVEEPFPSSAEQRQISQHGSESVKVASFFNDDLNSHDSQDKQETVDDLEQYPGEGDDLIEFDQSLESEMKKMNICGTQLTGYSTSPFWEMEQLKSNHSCSRGDQSMSAHPLSGMEKPSLSNAWSQRSHTCTVKDVEVEVQDTVLHGRDRNKPKADLETDDDIATSEDIDRPRTTDPLKRSMYDLDDFSLTEDCKTNKAQTNGSKDDAAKKDEAEDNSVEDNLWKTVTSKKKIEKKVPDSRLLEFRTTEKYSNLTKTIMEKHAYLKKSEAQESLEFVYEESDGMVGWRQPRILEQVQMAIAELFPQYSDRTNIKSGEIQKNPKIQNSNCEDEADSQDDSEDSDSVKRDAAIDSNCKMQ